MKEKNTIFGVELKSLKIYTNGGLNAPLTDRNCIIREYELQSYGETYCDICTNTSQYNCL